MTYYVKYRWNGCTRTYRTTDSVDIAFAALDYLREYQRHLKPWMET